MMKASLNVAAALAFLGVVSPASAETIQVIYSGVLANGNASGSPGLTSGLTGSLVGDNVQIIFNYNTAAPESFYTMGPTASSLALSGVNGANMSASVLFSNGAAFLTGDFGGSALDQATIGSTQQSATSAVTQFGSLSVFSASASNTAIPASITQSFALSNIDLDASFSISQTGAFGYDVYGDLTSGNIRVSSPAPVPSTPIPPALPLFATGLGALGLFGWYKKRKAKAALAGA